MYHNQVGFAIGTGRCGTQFLARVVELETHVASVHERNPLNETFHRYCKWNNLPVDHEGFLATKSDEIRRDLQSHHFSFEASAHLSLSVVELYKRFNAKFVLLIRSPERVVNSYVRKGWYGQAYAYADTTRAIGYQESTRFHRFLGRIIPGGEEYERWRQLTQVGKLAWYWNSLNHRVLEQFAQLPDNATRVVKLEELTFDEYQQIGAYFGYQSTISPDDFQNLRRSRPNAASNVQTIETWTAQEIAEFEEEVAPMATHFGYSFHVDRLPVPRPRKSTITKTLVSRIGRIKHGAYIRIRELVDVPEE